MFVLNKNIPDMDSLYTICGRCINGGVKNNVNKAFNDAVKDKWFCHHPAQPVSNGQVVVSSHVIKKCRFQWKWNALCLSGGYRYDQPTYQDTRISTCLDDSYGLVVNNTKWTGTVNHVVTGECKAFQTPTKSSVEPQKYLTPINYPKPCISTTTSLPATTTNLKWNTNKKTSTFESITSSTSEHVNRQTTETEEITNITVIYNLESSISTTKQPYKEEEETTTTHQPTTALLTADDKGKCY